ncbi:DnaJ domain-containing protein [Shimia gijangensis]|uniref:DnaJ domain-containing protein n=1 Tax=Shimia gijangensis TaxID=1470563 RepID=A0A1M6SG00_9RHOB|nr:DnaJ C-terminal domain-containing protein [Shimia gijangensis]SHK43672.1 DnaJ domain-containing protein [Shimia gijangensis]
MRNDPYKILGVEKTATQAEIKKAYRALAKKLHPDLHPGDSDKMAEFQAASAANDLLSDPDKRKRFDAGEIDASGQERQERQFYHQYANRDAGRRYDAGPDMRGFDNQSDLFAELFRQRQRSGNASGQEFHARGQDLRYHLDVDFIDAAIGAKRSVTMPDGKGIEISVPPGITDGQTLRLRGKGAPGHGQGPSGDAFVSISVRPHPVFIRDGDNIEVELPITFDEAVLGAKIEVPTISGAVSMAIPKGVSSGHRLRLKGKGITKGKGQGGDQFVRIKIVLPDNIDEQLEELATRWREKARFDPREELRRRT